MQLHASPAGRSLSKTNPDPVVSIRIPSSACKATASKKFLFQEFWIPLQIESSKEMLAFDLLADEARYEDRYQDFFGSPILFHVSLQSCNASFEKEIFS